jgi:hypothetical protein
MEMKKVMNLTNKERRLQKKTNKERKHKCRSFSFILNMVIKLLMKSVLRKLSFSHLENKNWELEE